MARRPRQAVRWGQQRRLELIEDRLCWDGRLNRADLCASFGISVPQASLDIARYRELAPRNLSYDGGTRSYVPGPRFRPIFASTSAQQFLQRLRVLEPAQEPGPIALMPVPARAIELAVLRPLWRAIRERTGLRVVYQSLSRPNPEARTLSPHALAHDGFRWHVRAYCHTRAGFRDFVIARVLEVKGTAPAGPGPEADHDWNTHVTLQLAPHPQLSAAHRRAIELDYGMVDGQAGVRCRRALLFYMLHHLRLDEGGSASPEAQQIVLENRAQITGLSRAKPPGAGAQASDSRTRPAKAR